MLRDANPDVDMSITTNGLLLDKLSVKLAEAGLDRVTVSCDSLQRHRFAEMTRRDALERVLQGLDAAEAAGLTPIKLNVVIIGGTNDDEVVEFAKLARRKGYEVRFIEYMPLDAEHAWERAKVVPSRPDPRRHRRRVPASDRTTGRAGNHATGSPTASPAGSA